MFVRARYLLCSVLGLIPLVTGAQAPHQSNMDLALRLVRLLRYEKQMETYREQCINAAQSVSAESLVREDPEKFGGVTPGSRHWPKIVQAYEQYHREVCARPTVEEFLNSLAKVYATNMSTAELNAAIQFYSTHNGQRLTEASTKAFASISALVSQAEASEVPKALAKFQRRIKAIARDAEADTSPRYPRK